MSTLDALRTLFKSQPKAVRREFVRRVEEDEHSSDNLRDDVVEHILDVRNGRGETYSFPSIAEAKKWQEYDV